MRLLIAEDNRDLNKALTAILVKNNYIVDSVSNGQDAYEYIMAADYDGAVLDIMMPGLDGIAVLSLLRSRGKSLPVLFLTAKSEIEDRVAGLDAGADDYLTKPFAMSEFLARVRAMLRRKADYRPDTISFSGISLNKGTYELNQGSRSIRLKGREFQMMEMLMESPRQVISTTQFMEHIWGWDSDVEVSIVWVYISNLRKLLSKIEASAEIRAIRGVGYCLDEKTEGRV